MHTCAFLARYKKKVTSQFFLIKNLIYLIQASYTVDYFILYNLLYFLVIFNSKEK